MPVALYIINIYFIDCFNNSCPNLIVYILSIYILLTVLLTVDQFNWMVDSCKQYYSKWHKQYR